MNAPAILRQFVSHSATTSPRYIQTGKKAALEAAMRQRRGESAAMARPRSYLNVSADELQQMLCMS